MRRHLRREVRGYEGEEDCSEVGFGLVAGIWLELGLDMDSECGADC